MWDYGRVSIEELVWVLIGVTAVIIHSWLINRAAGDYKNVVSRDWYLGSRKTETRGTLRREIFRLIAQIGPLYIGTKAMLTPRHPRSTAGLIFTAAFMLPQFLLMLNSLLDARQRINLNAAVRQERAESFNEGRRDTDHKG